MYTESNHLNKNKQTNKQTNKLSKLTNSQSKEHYKQSMSNITTKPLKPSEVDLSKMTYYP